MKFYYAPVAPNPTKVRVYIQEKGLHDKDVEMVPVDLLGGEQRSAAHLARNEAGTLPVLEIEGGVFVSESLSIMQYLEELYPDPPMIGATPLARTLTLQAERKIEMNVTLRIIRLIHATNSPLGLPNNPGIEKSERTNLPSGLSRTDALLAKNEFVMGDAPTICDCTLFAGCFFGEFFSWDIPADYPNLIRWYESFKQRPSAQL